jgi:hypothetical protein
MIRVFMAPPEVFPLVVAVYPMPLPILLMPLHQVGAIGTILVVVPYVIVMVFPIVISPFAMVVVVGSRRHWGDESDAQEQTA